MFFKWIYSVVKKAFLDYSGGSVLDIREDLKIDDTQRRVIFLVTSQSVASDERGEL